MHKLDILDLVDKLMAEIKVLEFAIHNDFAPGSEAEVRENLLRDYLDKIRTTVMEIKLVVE